MTTKPPATSPFRFGGIVACHQDGAPRGPGLIAELRRSDARVQYLQAGKNLWAPLATLRPVAANEAAGTLESLVSEILGILGGLEMEFSSTADGGRCRLIVSHGSLAPDAFDRLRSRLGAGLLACLVRPQGMYRIQTIVEFPSEAALIQPPAPRPRS